MEKYPIVSWFDKNSMLHLRFPFSFFLLPVYLFALSQAPLINWGMAVLSFVILHFLVFPSSNGYNSYQDHDKSSIGLLRNPPPVSKKLFYVSVFMDVLAIAAGVFISWLFTALVLSFILVSRAYSYRGIRLKRYPYLGFLVVSFFQGGVVYLASLIAISNITDFSDLPSGTVLNMAIASLFIGSIYPFTQIYQHEADKSDGVITISYKLGYIGTFIFSSILFLIATYLIYETFSGQVKYFLLFQAMMLPVVYWFIIWFFKVLRDRSQANFDNAMLMNLITSVCMNVFFLLLTLNRYGNWF
jgi:1,4-dihydroxy-2-naphthoate polyprenyltransferase